MGFFSHDSSEAQAHAQVTQAKHGASISHELIAAAASYEAAKTYETHVSVHGKPASHSKAKEILAAAVGAFVDREAETKGLSFVEKEKAKDAAKKHAEQALTDSNEF
ncbi:hypothetical protein K439DRAFT_1323984 [Ramaria rubella]|nr:hypothetical protein K439DRAFT_1323984 [Ramaria rubella]